MIRIKASAADSSETPDVGDILLEWGDIQVDQLIEGRRAQRATGADLGQILADLDFASAECVAEARVELGRRSLYDQTDRRS